MEAAALPETALVKRTPFFFKLKAAKTNALQYTRAPVLSGNNCNATTCSRVGKRQQNRWNKISRLRQTVYVQNQIQSVVAVGCIQSLLVCSNLMAKCTVFFTPPPTPQDTKAFSNSVQRVTSL